MDAAGRAPRAPRSRSRAGRARAAPRPAPRGAEAELLEARDLVLGEPLVGELGQRRATPERERSVQALEVAALDRTLEALAVELALLDAQQVAGRSGDEAVAELLPEQGDVVADDLGRGRRRRLVPELVDEPVDRDDLVGVEQQERDQRELPAAPEAEARPSSTTSSGPRMRNSIATVWRGGIGRRLARFGRPVAASAQCRLRPESIRKEREMRKAFNIVTVLVIAATMAVAAPAKIPRRSSGSSRRSGRSGSSWSRPHPRRCTP